jgi:hypothetical protein
MKERAMSKLDIFDRNAIALIVARRDVDEMDAAHDEVMHAYHAVWSEVQRMLKVPDSELETEVRKLKVPVLVFLDFHDMLFEMVGGVPDNCKTVGVETVLGYWLQSLDEAAVRSRARA